MNELKPCPCCGGEGKRVEDVFLLPTSKIAYCGACGLSTKSCATWEETESAWNRRAQPDQLPAATKLMPNEPLTIDDIKTLDYEPIWVEDISGCNTSCWAIAGRQRGSGIELYDEHCGEHYIDFAAWDNYGKTWLAYRRKKEET